MGWCVGLGVDVFGGLFSSLFEEHQDGYLEGRWVCDDRVRLAKERLGIYFLGA